MRKLLVALVLLLLVSGVPLQSAAASGEIHCQYSQQGSGGILGIQNGAGLPFYAVDAAGKCVASGQVTSSSYSVPVWNAAPGPLSVHVGTEVLLTASGDREADWQ